VTLAGQLRSSQRKYRLMPKEFDKLRDTSRDFDCEVGGGMSDLPAGHGLD
jgi:hypothetical protein